MKYALTVLIGMFVFLTACNNTPERPAAAAETKVQSAQPAPPAFDLNTPPQADIPSPEPPQNAEGVWHYTCPSGCDGGSGAADPCAKCGTTLVHNTAYHSSNKGQTVGSNIDNPIMLNGDNQTPVTPGGLGAPGAPPAPPAEPAQNAAGVWHYTCPSGCDGGAGSAIACAGCGTTLAHNSGYH